jgi:hypothetical protein
VKGLRLLILIVAALLISASSRNPRTDQHKKQSAEHSEGADDRKPEATIPLTVYESEQSALVNAQTELLTALRTINAQAEAATKQKHSDYEPWYAPAVLAQFALVMIGAVYSLFAWKQWGSIREQARIANTSLLLQFRPKLVIRNVVIKPAISDPKGDPNQTFIFFEGFPITGQFYVGNVGGSPATITQSLCMVHWQKGPLPMRHPYEGRNGNNPVVGRIEAGGRKTVVFASQKSLDLRPGDLGSIDIPGREPEWHIWIMGWIEYADQLAFGRRTAFCRQYDHRTNRFVVVNDPDYEHQE